MSRIRRWFRETIAFLTALPLIWVAHFVCGLTGKKIKSIEVIGNGGTIRVIEDDET